MWHVSSRSGEASANYYTPLYFTFTLPLLGVCDCPRAPKIEKSVILLRGTNRARRALGLTSFMRRTPAVRFIFYETEIPVLV